MAIDQLDLILQFSIRIVLAIGIMAIGQKVARMLARPTGTYGDGLPERRRRPRVIHQLPDASVAAGLREAGSRVAA